MARPFEGLPQSTSREISAAVHAGGLPNIPKEARLAPVHFGYNLVGMDGYVDFQQTMEKIQLFQKENPALFWERIGSVEHRWKQWRALQSIGPEDNNIEKAQREASLLWYCVCDDFTVVFD